MKRFYSFIAGIEKKQFYEVVFLLTADKGLGILLTWLGILSMKIVINFISDSNYKAAGFASVIAACIGVVFALLKGFLSYRRTMSEEILNDKVLLELSMNKIDIPMYDLSSTKTKDSFDKAKKALNRNSVKKMMSFSMEFIGSVVEISTAVGVLILVKSPLVLLMIGIAVIAALVNKMTLKIDFKRDEEEVPIERRFYYYRDYVTGPVFAKEVRSFGLADFVGDKIKEGIDAFYKLEMKTLKNVYKSRSLLYVANIVQYCVVYAVMAVYLVDGKITPGEFTEYTAALFLLSSALGRCISMLQNIKNETKYTDFLCDFRDLTRDNMNRMEKYPDTLDDGNAVEIDNISFRYSDDGRQVINNLSLNIKKGEKICLVGENGCGKTTLTKLIMGILSLREGSIRIENDEKVEACRDNIAAVFQDFVIYPFSIGENVALQSDYDREKVSSILGEVGLFEKMESIRNDLDLPVSDRLADKGTDFSGGEEQLLAMARVLYKGSDILILDEPTASLSPQHEYDFYTRFYELTANKTVIFISHRLAACRLVNRICVMENGTISEEGTHDELMKKGGLYSRMYSRQAEYYKVK